MHRKAIHRGGILSAGYDRTDRVLEIEFDTHRILRYEGVGQAVADRFLESDSPLSHYKDEIEEEYPCREVGQEAHVAPNKKKSGVPDALRALFEPK